jgi:hypothetical protein
MAISKTVSPKKLTISYHTPHPSITPKSNASGARSSSRTASSAKRTQHQPVLSAPKATISMYKIIPVNLYAQIPHSYTIKSAYQMLFITVFYPPLLKNFIWSMLRKTPSSSTAINTLSTLHLMSFLKPSIQLAIYLP